MVYGDMLRPIGIGMLIGGALMGVIKAFPAVKAAFKTLKSAAQSGFKGGDELPIKFIYGGIALAFVTLFVAALFGAKNVSIPHSIDYLAAGYRLACPGGAYRGGMYWYD